MLLYHGTNIIVRKPEILNILRIKYFSAQTMHLKHCRLIAIINYEQQVFFR